MSGSRRRPPRLERGRCRSLSRADRSAADAGPSDLAGVVHLTDHIVSRRRATTGPNASAVSATFRRQTPADHSEPIHPADRCRQRRTDSFDDRQVIGLMDYEQADGMIYLESVSGV
jgi:hypothetical protein